MDYNTKINEYIKLHNIKAQHLELNVSCHSVIEAAEAVNATVEDFVKNICMIDDQNRLIVAIVKGEDRASTSRVGKALAMNPPRLANEVEVQEFTGYPAGGVPSFGFNAMFLMDPKVIDSDCIYTGGGSPNSLVKISVKELLEVNNAKVVRVRK